MARNAGPLADLVVVDLSTTLASAYTSLVYADYGAEVISVEPLEGSPLRRLAAWPFWLRGKKSIALDLHDPADQEVARSLSLGADVVIESFRPGTAERFGLGYEDLRPDNPRVVYTSITGFGRTGPYARVKSYEAVVMAKTGSMYGNTAPHRSGPVMLIPFGATLAASLLALQGSLVALHERQRSGHGQRVDATMVQGMLAQDPWAYLMRKLALRFPDAYAERPTGPAASRVPTSWLGFGLLNGYSADGHWLQFAHATPRQFEAFVRACGLEWTRTDPEWKDAPNSEDEAQRAQWWEMMLRAVRSKTVAQWQDVFDHDKDTFAEVYRGGTDLFDHPQFVHDHHVVDVEHPDLGPVRQLNVLVKMSKSPGTALGVPPALDANGAELRARPIPATVRADQPAPAPAPPLAGLLVVDLGTFYAGPFGSTMLADHGARVIKVEPLDGDPIRFQMPIPEAGGVRVTQGKESLAIDVFTDEGRAVVVELVRRADMVLHSYRGGVAERMGLDADTMLAVNPNLVYHHGVGYGIDGPYARRAAFAPTIAAGSGFARRSGGGGPEGVPLSIDEIKQLAVKMGGAPAGHPDGFASLGVAAAMALGLVARDLGAGGQATMTSMLSTMGHVMGDVMIQYEGAAAPLSPDPDQFGFGALYRLYETAEGWVVLCVTEAREWAALTDALADVVRLGDDARFTTPTSRLAHDDELAAVLSAAFRTKRAADWEHRMVAADVACVEVAAASGGLGMGLFDDGGLAEQLGMLTEVTHPLFERHVRSTELVRLSRGTATLGAGCTIGQHTTAILEELGYDRDQIATLREKGIINA